MEQGHVSGGVSLLCWLAAPVANVLWKPPGINRIGVIRTTKQKYQGMFETKKYGNKEGQEGFSKAGQDQVSGRVSVPCWHTTPIAQILLKPLLLGNGNFG